MSINATKSTFRDHAAENHMGAPSYIIQNPVKRLEIAAASCFFGEPSFYQRDRVKMPFSHSRNSTPFDLKKIMQHLTSVMPVMIEESLAQDVDAVTYLEKMIDDAINHDVEATLALAASLRFDHKIRTTPQVILVRASRSPDVKGTQLIRQYGEAIIGRVDDMTTQLAYHLAVYGKNVSSALKRLWKQQIEQRFDAYGLAKYRMSNREVSLVDLVRFCHAKGDHVDQLMRNELKLEGATWESLISERGASQETWSEAIPKMGHMALLRNLRNLLKHDVDPSLYVDRLVSTASKGQQLPFRYLSAYKAIEGQNPRVLDAIESCLQQSLEALPRFKGRVASLCDNSGSALGTMTSSMGTVTVNQIANLTGVLTGMRADEGYVGVFGDNLDMQPIRKTSSVLDQANKMNEIGDSIGGATECGIWTFWDRAIESHEHWDAVFVYSDMQAGHGGLYGVDPSIARKGFVLASKSISGGREMHYIDVPRLIQTYREKVNPDVQVFLVQMAGYDDTLVPQYFDKTYILGGWSDAILKFADKMIQHTS